MSPDIRSGRLYWIWDRGHQERVIAIAPTGASRWLCERETISAQELTIDASSFIRPVDESVRPHPVLSAVDSFN
jgi:hypothetical protein